MQISELHNIFISYPNISTDTRTLKKDDIFFALKGDNFDGNKYIKIAIKNGASHIITDEIQNKNISNCIYVKDSLETLQQLAKYHREKINIPIIAITGTNGKTTTKELIAQVLKQKFNIGYTKGNLNNHIGVPLTLLSFTKNTEIGIVEMGANHPKEIELLCNIATPNYGIITNIGKAHLEGFGTFENLIKTKAELYKSIQTTDGKIFLNNDNKLLTSIITKQKTITYGKNDNAYCKGKFLSANPFVKLSINNTIINSNLIGSYNFENLLAASCVGKYFKVNTEKIKFAIENYIPTNNRSQIIKKNTNNIILDAYNANPTSMSLAIENFANIKAEKKVLILGDMFELGDFAEEEHKKILKKLLTLFSNNDKIKIFIAGIIFNKINYSRKISSFVTTIDLIKHLSTLNLKNNWFLIKGSRGMKLEETINYL